MISPRRTPTPSRPDTAGLGFLLRHLGGGALAAVVFMALILGSDLAGLRGLIFGSGIGLLGGALLLFGLIVTFGSVAMGAAIMTLNDKRR